MTSTVLIGLDGMTFRILDPLMRDGVMPCLRELCDGGVRAELLSTANPMTILAWPSLMTGRNPGAHGCFDFVRAEDRDGAVSFTFADGRDLRCETIWALTTAGGRRATVLNFPMTFPHPAIAGHLVPGLISSRRLPAATQPAGLYETLSRVPGIDGRRLAWDFERGNRIAGGVDPDEYESWIDHYTVREAHWFRAARYLQQTEPSDLLAILFDGADKIFHVCWRVLDPRLVPPSPSAWEQAIRQRCLRYFRLVDRYIEALVRGAGPEARVFVVSDHGFTASTEVFHANAWLAERGYLKWRDGCNAEEGAGAERPRQQTDDDLVPVDWAQTRVYAPTSSANGLYIRVARRAGDVGVTADDYQSFRDRLVDELAEVISPDSGERVVVKALKREEIYSGPAVGRAPDLTLVLRDSGFVSTGPSAAIVECRAEPCGTHEREGIFIARGPGLVTGSRATPLSILDVAPLVLHSLGLELPDEIEGIFHEGLWLTSWLDAHPVRVARLRRGTPGDAAGDGRSDGRDRGDEALIRQRLRSLGYLR